MFVLGDVPVDDTLFCPFDTFDSNGESVTITGLAVTDVEIYKDGSVTQRASDNGITLLDTDGIDFDGAVGLHGFSVDLSDNSDAGFYVAGSAYWINVNAITVDSRTVRFTYHFTIGKLLRPTTAGRTLDVTATGAAGIDWGNVENQSTAVNLSGTTVNLCNTITTYTGNTLQTGDSFDRIGATGSGLTSLAQASLVTAARMAVLTEWINGGRLDLILDIIAADTTTDIPALIAALNNLSQANIRSAVGLAAANLDTQLADIPTVAEFEARTILAANYGTAANQTVIVGYIDTEIGTIITHLTEIKGATFSGATDSLEALRDRGDAAWTTGAGTGLTALASGTAQSGTASTIVLASGETFADDELNGNIVKITSGTGAGQSRLIISNTLVDDTCNILPNWTTNPASDSVYEIVEGSANIEAINLDNPSDQIGQLVHPDTYFVSKTGNDGNSGLSSSTATLTIGQAVTLASAGDIIRIGPGTFDEAVDSSGLGGLHFIGSGQERTIISNAGITLTVTSATTIEDLSCTSTNTGIHTSGGDNITIRRCFISGSTDGLYAKSSDNLLVEFCWITSVLDAAQVSQCQGLLMRYCTISTPGGAVFGSTALLTDGSDGVIESCVIQAVKTSGNDSDMIAVSAGDHNGSSRRNTLHLLNCTIICTTDRTGSASDIYGIRFVGHASWNGVCKVTGGSIFTLHGGDGTAYDLSQSVAGVLQVSDLLYDTSKTSGTITDLTNAILVDTTLIGQAFEEV